MERFTETIENGRKILRHGISDILKVGFGRFFCGEAIDRLSEYEDLEEQGKLLKLPCAVGDTVWDNSFGQPCSYTVTGFSFGKIDGNEEDNIDGLQMYYRNCDGSVRCNCSVSKLGEWVFMTREEAEAELKEL